MHCMFRVVAMAVVAVSGKVANLTAQNIEVFVLIPPEQVLPAVRQLAVMDFGSDGDYGKTFSGYVVEHLMSNDRGIHELKKGFLGMGEAQPGRTLQKGAVTNVFELIERSRLGQVISEQRLGSSGLVDEAGAVQIGKILGVDAIVIGSLVIAHKDKPEQRQYTSDGRTYVVRCIKREVKVTARARIVHVETAKILGTTERSGETKGDKCEPKLDDLKSVMEMADGVSREVADEIASYMAPRFELQKFDLRRVPGREIQALVKTAAEAAEDLRVDEAYAIYKSLYDQDPYVPELAHNLGVLQEVVGNQSEAEEYYGIACQLKDEKDCRRGLERTAQASSFQEALRALGVQITHHDFPTAEDALASATARNLEVRGKSEDRVSVLAEPRDDSEVVASVPGGVTFAIVDEAGEWYRIRLIGGKEGYIHRDRVKVKG